MSTIKEFNSQNLKGVRIEVMNALKEVEEKYGLTFKLGTMRYEGGSFRSTLECNTKRSIS